MMEHISVSYMFEKLPCGYGSALADQLMKTTIYCNTIVTLASAMHWYSDGDLHYPPSRHYAITSLLEALSRLYTITNLLGAY